MFRRPVLADDEKLGRDEARSVARRVARMLRPEWGRIAVAFLCILGQVACLLAGPALVRRGIDQGLLENDAGALNQSALLFLIVSFGRAGPGTLRDPVDRTHR